VELLTDRFGVLSDDEVRNVAARADFGDRAIRAQRRPHPRRRMTLRTA
jgi:hypothetical protein